MAFSDFRPEKKKARPRHAGTRAILGPCQARGQARPRPDNRPAGPKGRMIGLRCPRRPPVHGDRRALRCSCRAAFIGVQGHPRGRPTATSTVSTSAADAAMANERIARRRANGD